MICQIKNGKKIFAGQCYSGKEFQWQIRKYGVDLQTKKKEEANSDLFLKREDG